MALVLTGCSKFRSQREMDLKPFAEDMIAVAGDVQFGLGQTHIIYLRDYRHLPEVEHLDEMAAKARRLIRGTIAYAIQVVTLAESHRTGPEQAHALAEYIDALLRPVLTAPRPPLNMTVAQLDTLVDEIRGRKELLDALDAAQPIIDEIARASGEFFDETKSALDAMIAAVQDRIDVEIKPVVDADKGLRDAQIETTQNLRYLKQYRLGDAASLDSLMRGETSLEEFDMPKGGPSVEFMHNVEERLAAKLRFLREVRDQLRPDVELYWKQQEELEKITASYNAALRQASVAVLAWARAHARLAAGVTNPAEIDVLGIARKAAGSAVPIP